jgi:hypothetical protein
MWSYQVNLDKRVRDDHPLRRINQVLDLGFVRKQVAHTYGQRGNKSVPPEVIIRMMLFACDEVRLALDSIDTNIVVGHRDKAVAGHPRLHVQPDRCGRHVELCSEG